MVRPALALCLAALVALLQGCADCEAAAEPGTLCRIAGTGKSAFNGDGLPARETDFYQVTAAGYGPDGRLYVMDFNNHRLRRLGAEGTVETVVGTGEHAFARPGEPATASPLENPVDFAFDADGVLHLVMLHDPRVLRIADGEVEVAAGSVELGDDGDGGPAGMARFTQLASLAFGPDGTLYLCDELSHRVRKVRPDGLVLPVAGTGVEGYDGDGGPATEASLDHPRGLALGPDGSLYVADTGNHVVRRVDPDGVITTFAGTGEPGDSGDGGPAVEARLRRPSGVAVAADGTVFIADTENNRVRRVDPDGTLSTVVGTGEPGTEGEGGPAAEARISSPWGLEVDPERLVISELRSGTVGVVFR